MLQNLIRYSFGEGKTWVFQAGQQKAVLLLCSWVCADRALITAGKQSVEVFDIKWALKHLVANDNQLHTQGVVLFFLLPRSK